jgi:hypothetical protein
MHLLFINSHASKKAKATNGIRRKTCIKRARKNRTDSIEAEQEGISHERHKSQEQIDSPTNAKQSFVLYFLLPFRG